jgi:hypothetical protein
MDDQLRRHDRQIAVPRWAARAWSIGSIALVLAFIVGERSLPSTWHEWLGFLFFPLGMCAGLVVAWWRERLGGLVAIASLTTLYLIVLAMIATFPHGWAWFVFSVSGFLFLVTDELSRRPTGPARPEPRG